MSKVLFVSLEGISKFKDYDFDIGLYLDLWNDQNKTFLTIHQPLPFLLLPLKILWRG